MRTCAFAATLMGAAGLATAGPLNLVLESNPDVVSGFIDVVYNANADLLTLDGFALEIDPDGSGNVGINNGSFLISLAVDDAGFVSGGSLTMTGDIPSMGLSGTLLTGTVNDFGFLEAGGDPLEFVFDLSGGLLAPIYGAQAGVIAGGTMFPGSFAADFDNLIGGIGGTGTATADTGRLVPTPGGIALFGLACIATRRRRS